LYQGSTLIPYLFTLVLDVLTKHIQQLAPRSMRFADDVVLIGELMKELNEMLETWRQILEGYGFRPSKRKTQYI